MYHRTISAIAFMAGIFLCANADAQTTQYVDIANCPGPGSGTEGDPFCKIQDGIDAAVDGDTVLIADGTYTGFKNKNLSFGGKAITVQSENGAENCIIDCEWSGRGFLFFSGEDQSSVLDGLTIMNGDVATSGGGIAIIYSSPIIQNCTLVDNDAGERGGGLYCLGSSPTITHCRVLNNGANFGGGAASELSGNPTISDSIIFGNVAIQGGGLHFTNPSNPLVVRCTIQGNEASAVGGGIHSESCSPTVESCVLSNNRCWDRGGGFHHRFSGHLVLNNCTLTGKEARRRGGSGFVEADVTISSSILWANYTFGSEDGFELWHQGGALFVRWSDIQDGHTGTGNIDEDPLFADPDNDDFHLTVDSPCIDAGDPDFVPDPEETDIDGEDRVAGDDVDMGADEYHDSDGDGVPDITDPCPLDNPDDTDGDGVCDTDDPCPSDNPDDTDGDGVCDSVDPCPLDNPDDSDDDGVCDSDDLCVGDDSTGDSDGDGICDDLDICEGDDASGDADADGVCGDIDNCELFNPDQIDCQPNGVGDVCDIVNGPSNDNNDNGVPDECDPCLADLNGDGVVAAEDLAFLLGSWGPCDGCPADIFNDGDVNAGDLAILLGAWGPCP